METLEVLLNGDAALNSEYNRTEVLDPYSMSDSTHFTGPYKIPFGDNGAKSADSTSRTHEGESVPGLSSPTTASNFWGSRFSSSPFATLPAFSERKRGAFGGPVAGPARGPMMFQNERRTILVSKLSEGVTLQDLTKIIKGGRILEMNLCQDHKATISFVEGASNFLAYTKREDVYLFGKRLDFCWDQRQVPVPNHVINMLSNGASRNIVIRRAKTKNGRAAQSSFSEQSIRDDLEHIDTLQVVSVTFKDGDCYISTNSVRNAMYARTCMMSRAKYKGLRIEWYPDECARPLPPQVQKRQPTLPNGRNDGQNEPQKPASKSTANRFGILDTSDADDSGEETDFFARDSNFKWADDEVSV